ncbi:NADH:ubiquinone oxidoreductase [Acetobacter musti]|uniref:NADH:ubiquinone oxidoreductase n=1 Tax=Acetobacter musti TaxID=864732 RepID=A0ABX0JS63_9PROT|nr:NADH:ubiquinone oxidoreductase [Acetobacter musti]NHN85371.1 NADH:ubiquinone oxidoreductase [Acetobacter musti]
MNSLPVVFGNMAALPDTMEKTAREIIRSGEPAACHWRFRLDELKWQEFVRHLGNDPAVFIGLWCDGDEICAAVNDGSIAETGPRPLMVSYRLDGPRFPGLSRVRIAAAPFERMIRDLWGVEAMEGSDLRPLVDHGTWSCTAPLAKRPGPAPFGSDLPEFARPDPQVAAHGMIFGRGPATGSADGPVHFRLGIANGLIRTVETRAGYAHRGIIARMRGATIPRVTELAGRVGAGSAVAHQWAFSAAVENATGIVCTTAASRSRVVLTETERIATHLLTLARTARSVEAASVATGLYRLREQILCLCGKATGRRLLMDFICPGGLIPLGRQDMLSLAGIVSELSGLCVDVVSACRFAVSELRALWQVVPGMKRRLQNVGRLTEEQSKMLGLQGSAGRACGYGGDLRLHLNAYGEIPFRPAVSIGGDILTRSEILFEEITESIRILENLADRISSDPEDEAESLCVSVSMPSERCDGYAAIEGPHGPVWYFVTLENGRIEHCFISDPAPVLLMATELVLPGTSPDNFDPVRYSFGVSIAAADL